MAEPTATVAAGHPETVHAAAGVLRDGGNAVDAAIAAVLASFVCEVGLTGPFGGGFALVAPPGGAPVAFDFFADVPGRGLPAIDLDVIDFDSVDVNFGPTQQTFHVGRGSAAMSSVLEGLRALHDRFATRDLLTLARPALTLAREGTRLTPQTAHVMAILEPILRYTPESDVLFAPRGRLPGAGEAYPNPGLASLLAKLDAESVHRETAKLAEVFAPPAGLITPDDLDAYVVTERPPLHVPVRDFDVYLNPPPSSGGVLIAFGLRLLDRVEERVWRDPLQTSLHLLAAMAVTFRARAERLDEVIASSHGDAAVAEELVLTDAFIDEWWPEFLDAVKRGPLPGSDEGPPTPGNTTHVSVVDANGLACTLTSSNGEGSGTVVPGTGALGNNFLGESDLNPRGFHANPVGVRLTSMMCPTIIARGGEPLYALGSGGSNRIRTALLQVIARRLLCESPLVESVEAPRLHLEHDTVYVERQCAGRVQPPGLLHALRGTKVVEFQNPSMFFGGVHVASHLGYAAGDPRRQGAVEILPRVDTL